jgi:hypothetical protein
MRSPYLHFSPEAKGFMKMELQPHRIGEAPSVSTVVSPSARTKNQGREPPCKSGGDIEIIDHGCQVKVC